MNKDGSRKQRGGDGKRGYCAQSKFNESFLECFAQMKKVTKPCWRPSRRRRCVLAVAVAVILLVVVVTAAAAATAAAIATHPTTRMMGTATRIGILANLKLIMLLVQI